MSNNMRDVQSCSRRDIPECPTLRDVLYEADAASITTSHEEWMALKRYRQVLREHMEIVDEIIKMEEAMRDMEGEVLEQARAEWQAARAKQSELYHCFCEMEGMEPISTVMKRLLPIVDEVYSRWLTETENGRRYSSAPTLESAVYSVSVHPKRTPMKTAEPAVCREVDRKNGKNSIIMWLLALAAIAIFIYVFK